MQRIELDVDRMSCGHCVLRVTESLKALPGVRIDQVEIGRVVLQFDPSTTRESQIREAVERAGYPVVSLKAA